MLKWLAVAVAVYALAVAALIVAGRRAEARALAGAIPDCLNLIRRLLRDPRVPRRYKIALGAALAYLLFPLDLVPDFIPVAGQADDVVVVAFALRMLVRADPGALRRHWTGPEPTFRALERMSGLKP